MKCEFGYCTVCEKVIASGEPKRPTQDYTEVQMEWSNGSKMKIAVCVDCAKTHRWATPEAKDGITKAHWDAWDKQNALYDRAVTLV